MFTPVRSTESKYGLTTVTMVHHVTAGEQSSGNQSPSHPAHSNYTALRPTLNSKGISGQSKINCFILDLLWSQSHLCCSNLLSCHNWIAVLSPTASKKVTLSGLTADISNLGLHFNLFLIFAFYVINLKIKYFIIPQLQLTQNKVPVYPPAHPVNNWHNLACLSAGKPRLLPARGSMVLLEPASIKTNRPPPKSSV